MVILSHPFSHHPPPHPHPRPPLSNHPCQVGQIILEEMIRLGKGAECSMICTQPRRLSAISVAERVAEEMGERIGSLVGYSIRLEAKQTQDTRMLFCTTGTLLPLPLSFSVYCSLSLDPPCLANPPALSSPSFPSF